MWGIPAFNLFIDFKSRVQNSVLRAAMSAPPGPARPTGVTRTPRFETANILRPHVADNPALQSELVIPRQRSGGLVAFNQIERSMYMLTIGHFDSFQVDYWDLPEGWPSLIPFMLREGRFQIELADGTILPWNDWNRVSMMHASQFAMMRGAGSEIGSDLEEVVTAIMQNSVFTIRQVGLLRRMRNAWGPRANPRFAFAYNFTQRPIPTRVRTRPFGAFYPYYQLLSQVGIDWERYGITNEDKVVKVPCLWQALKVQGLPIDKLNKLKSLMVSKIVPRCKLPKICNILHIRIRLSLAALDQKDHCYYYPNRRDRLSATQKEWPLYKIGMTDDHYFSDDKHTDITKHALQTFRYEADGKGLSRWHRHMLSSGRLDRRKALRSTTLFQLLRDPSIRGQVLRPHTLTRDNLDHLFYRDIEKSYTSLKPFKNDFLPYGEYPIPENQKWRKKSRNESKNDEPYVKLWINYVADFETTTDSDIHLPFMVCWKRLRNDEEFKNGRPEYETHDAFGINCAKTMLESCFESYDPDLHEGLRFIFHNLSYDARFLLNHFRSGKPPSILESGTRIKSLSATYRAERANSEGAEDCTVVLTDSYAFIPTPLSKFPKMFNLQSDIKKELIPYNLYSTSRVFETRETEEGKEVVSYDNVGCICTYSEVLEATNEQEIAKVSKFKYAVQNSFQRLNAEDRRSHERFHLRKWKETLDRNIRAWKLVDSGQSLEEDTEIDMMQYALEYCRQDVSVLAHSWQKFRHMCREALGGLDINCHDSSHNPYVSINQTANQYLKEQGAFEKCCWMTGVVRDFLQNCVSGGKCMLANNEKQRVQDSVDDFDACSLYPSAMYFMGGFLQGSPKEIPTHTRVEDLSKWDGYFLRIRILSFGGIRRRFPILSYRNSDGGRVYSDGDDMLGREIYVCKFEVEDALEFYKGKFRFEILQGVYFDEGRNTKIRDIVRDLYDRRRVFKQQKNPIQIVLKLIMNAMYGRLVLKPIDNQVIFKSDIDHLEDPHLRHQKKAELDNFYEQHFYRIKRVTEMLPGSPWTWRFDCLKDINEHYNAPHLGSEVLAYSKRIMNRVMCLAEDNKIEIYYQDTDSMHIKRRDIKPLADAFRERYGSELIGNDLGQFHSDFDLEDMSGGIHKENKSWPKFKDEDIMSTLFIGVGKKAYLDCLVAPTDDSSTIEGYHVRLKGIPTKAIYEYCIEKGVTLVELFEELYDGKSHTFNIAAGGRPMFVSNRNMTVSNRTGGFHRAVQFKQNISEDSSRKRKRADSL